MRWNRVPVGAAGLVVGALASAVTAPAGGQELEPRRYTQTPVGVNFIAAGYGVSSGNVLMDPALPLEGLDSTIDLVFVRYTRTLGFLQRSAKLKVLVPWSAGDWQATLEGDDFESLILATVDGGRLSCVGRVGTGFDARTRNAINEWLRSHAARRPLVRSREKGRWVSAGLYCSVRYFERTKNGGLRAPVFDGLIADVD